MIVIKDKLRIVFASDKLDIKKTRTNLVFFTNTNFDTIILTCIKNLEK